MPSCEEWCEECSKNYSGGCLPGSNNFFIPMGKVEAYFIIANERGTFSSKQVVRAKEWLNKQG